MSGGYGEPSSNQYPPTTAEKLQRMASGYGEPPSNQYPPTTAEKLQRMSMENPPAASVATAPKAPTGVNPNICNDK
jgi:hypothetical protein